MEQDVFSEKFPISTDDCARNAVVVREGGQRVVVAAISIAGLGLSTVSEARHTQTAACAAQTRWGNHTREGLRHLVDRPAELIKELRCEVRAVWPLDRASLGIDGHAQEEGHHP
jgi:hypothetical protein